MDPKGYPSFTPGQTYSLDEIREMHRMAQTTAYASAATSEMDLVGGVPYINTPATYGYSGFWAKVTVNLGSALYTVVQQQDNGTGTAWQNVPGGFTGTAFEVNSNTSVPADPSTGPLVWVVQSDAPQGYQFAYDANLIGGVDLQSGVTYTFQLSDDTKLVSFANASAMTGTLPQPSSLTDHWFCSVENRGSGTLTLQPDTLSTPAAPTLDNSTTGGTVTAGVYQVKITYVNVNGESTPSPSSSITIVAPEKLTIRSPVATTGSGAATGWYAYVTTAGGSTYYRQQSPGSPTAISTDLVLSADPTTGGANPPGSNTASVALIDGAASLAIPANQGVQLFTNGTNYYTMRGMGAGGITVETVNPGTGDSAASHSSITDLQFDLTSGFAFGTVSAGTAEIVLQAASDTHWGVLTTGAQNIAGQKLFFSPVYSKSGAKFGSDGTNHYGTTNVTISGSGLTNVGTSPDVILEPIASSVVGGGGTNGTAFRILAMSDAFTGSQMFIDWDNANSRIVFGGAAGAIPGLTLKNQFGADFNGWSGSFTVVTSVNFGASTVTTKTVTVTSGLITNVA